MTSFIIAITAETSKRDRALFLTAYRHGLRASEIGMLQRTDVDLKRGHITIQRFKGSLSGLQSMQPDEQKLIRSYLASRKDHSPYLFISNRNLPIDHRTLWVLMRDYAEAAGIPASKRKLHPLKHRLATHLLDAGADLSFVKDWLGHANIQNTTIYAQLTNVKRGETARRLFASHWVV
ncbi:MAG TPA: tyrosine-type recombinase/integrase [Candidatus Binatia bacterium]|nr:tyrosine-type recombinase/integrase [Candidatus Binatia bacterium]